MNCSFLQRFHIHVAVYDDRREITSPGGLLPGVTLDKMKEGYSKIRNRALAHAFSYMNLIEAWGSGIPKLMAAMREYGLREPEFLNLEIGFRVNLYRSTESVHSESNQGTTQATQGITQAIQAATQVELTEEGESGTAVDSAAAGYHTKENRRPAWLESRPCKILSQQNEAPKYNPACRDQSNRALGVASGGLFITPYQACFR